MRSLRLASFFEVSLLASVCACAITTTTLLAKVRIVESSEAAQLLLTCIVLAYVRTKRDVIQIPIATSKMDRVSPSLTMNATKRPHFNGCFPLPGSSTPPRSTVFDHVFAQRCIQHCHTGTIFAMCSILNLHQMSHMPPSYAHCEKCIPCPVSS